MQPRRRASRRHTRHLYSPPPQFSIKVLGSSISHSCARKPSWWGMGRLVGTFNPWGCINMDRRRRLTPCGSLRWPRFHQRLDESDGSQPFPLSQHGAHLGSFLSTRAVRGDGLSHIALWSGWNLDLGHTALGYVGICHCVIVIHFPVKFGRSASDFGRTVSLHPMTETPFAACFQQSQTPTRRRQAGCYQAMLERRHLAATYIRVN